MIKQLLPLLIQWLQHPVVELRMTPSDEIDELRAELQSAKTRVEELEQDVKLIRSKYVMACELNLCYVDLLNQHGINHRHLR